MEYARWSGVVMEICAQVGELVQRGQRLIEVENDALHLALAKSEQQLDL